MGNYENIKDKGFDNRSTNEVREIAARGGRASGEARRRKADFRKTLNVLLTTQIDSPEWTPVLEALGVDPTLESAVNMAMIKKALAGNVKAYEAIARFSGQSEKSVIDDTAQEIQNKRNMHQYNVETGSQEVDDTDENIQSFLKAMQPSQDNLNHLFAEEGNDAEEKDQGNEV